MNIKSILFLILIFCSFKGFTQSSSVEKKSKWFRRMQTGYSFISGSGYNVQHIENANGTTTTTTTLNQVSYSYGKGFNLSYGVGYMFNENFGAELSLSYFIGGRSERDNRYHYDTISTPYVIDQNIKSRSNLFRINPSFIFMADMNKIAPYAKVGFIIGWGNAVVEINEDVNYYNGSKENGQFEWRYRGASPFGLSSSVGIKTQRKESNMNFFIELSYISMQGSFKSGEKTHHIINGKEYIQNVSPSNKQIVFVNEVIEDAPKDPTKPTQVLKTKQSYDSIGFNLGIIFNM